MKKALIGYGGHAREVMCQMNKKLDCFVDDEFLDSNTLSLSKFDPNVYEVMICISNPKARYEIVNKLPKETKYFSFIHPTALILSDDVYIDEGTFIGAYSILTTNISLEKHSILNRGCQIGHDSNLGDFLTMMPGSVISGNCKIGNRVYIGTNSSVREKINICDDVIIGLNSGVVKDINEPGIYGGTPCKLIKNINN
jgi:sugar O-acyltransferase (sialic acid O-acetyltransferase NeuD family)